MRTAIVFLLLLVFVPGSSLAARSEHREVLYAALKYLENKFGITIDEIALASALPQDVRQAAKELRSTIEISELRPAMDEHQPSSRLLLHRVEVQGQAASFNGSVGAILNPNPTNLHACGSGYSLSFALGANGAWNVVNGLIENC